MNLPKGPKDPSRSLFAQPNADATAIFILNFIKDNLFNRAHGTRLWAQMKLNRNFDHGNLNPIYELSPKGKLPKICPLRRTRSHHCVALNLALLASRKLFHLPLF